MTDVKNVFSKRSQYGSSSLAIEVKTLSSSSRYFVVLIFNFICVVRFDYLEDSIVLSIHFLQLSNLDYVSLFQFLFQENTLLKMRFSYPIQPVKKDR